MGKIFGGGSSKQTTTTNVNNDPWSQAQPYLKDILSQADKLFDQNGGINQDFIDKKISALTPEMQSAVKGLINNEGLKGNLDSAAAAAKSGNSAIGTANQNLTSLAGKKTTSADIVNEAKGLYDNDTVNSQINKLGTDVRDQLGKNLQINNQNATQTGNMGSSRAGVAQGVATGKAAQAIADGSAAIQNDARTKAYNMASDTLNQNTTNQLSANGKLASLGLGSGNLQSSLNSGYNQALQNKLTGAGITQNQAQNVLNNDWFNAVGQQNQGWDNLGKLSGITTAIGNGGGTSGGTSTTSGGSGGGLFNNILGMGSTIAGMGNAFGWWGGSDTSLKTNVKKIGKDEQGNARYEWEWNKAANKQGLKGKSKGVLAQQVAKDKPKAVARDAKSGKMKVDYGILGGK